MDTYLVNDWLFEQARIVDPTNDEVTFAYVYLARQGGYFYNQRALPTARALYRKSAAWKAKMEKWVSKDFFPYDSGL